MKRQFASVIAAVSLFGCAPLSTGTQVQTGREFDITAGHDVVVEGPRIAVTFKGVTSDSRCAVDVQCVWAGNAAVKITLTKGSGPATEAVLNTGIEPRSIVYADHTVRLIGLKPLPHSGQTIPPGDYVATFEVVSGTASQ
jgi:hypothetical protein